MRTIDHLPELENSHTAMSSTWDRSGGNVDGTDFKNLVEASAESPGRNVLLDVAGPGCIHRTFVGRLGPQQAGTRIQVFLDRQKKPVFDMPILEFFDDEYGPFPYPLVFHKSYPGTLFPIPFEKHCLVQLVNGSFGDPDWKNASWSNYWQITYTRYPASASVKSLDWPHEHWWGEGDWLIWTDRDQWPPSYHGTGSEEYFNSGWCRFDRKAVSGFATLRPGHPTVYSFHLNDAFQFQRKIRVAEEQMGLGEGGRLIHQDHPIWSSTAYWYALPAQPADSNWPGSMDNQPSRLL